MLNFNSEDITSAYIITKRNPYSIEDIFKQRIEEREEFELQKAKKQKFYDEKIKKYEEVKFKEESGEELTFEEAIACSEASGSIFKILSEINENSIYVPDIDIKSYGKEIDVNSIIY